MGEGGPLGAVRVAVDDAAAGRWEALNHLVEVLLEVDAAGDEVVARSALTLVAGVAEVMPFLVLHTADWVKPVRDRARAGLALLLADDPNGYLPAVLPMALRLDARLRGGFAVTQIRAALLSAPPEVWRGLLGSGGRRRRRFVFDIVLAQGWLRLPDLVTCAETDSDVGIRVRAADAACREAVDPPA